MLTNTGLVTDASIAGLSTHATQTESNLAGRTLPSEEIVPEQFSLSASFEDLARTDNDTASIPIAPHRFRTVVEVRRRKTSRHFTTGRRELPIEKTDNRSQPDSVLGFDNNPRAARR